MNMHGFVIEVCDQHTKDPLQVISWRKDLDTCQISYKVEGMHDS